MRMNKKILFVLIIFLLIAISTSFYLFLQKTDTAKLELQQIIEEKNISPQGGAYGRVEAIIINNKLFMAFNDREAKNFKLVKMNDDLSHKGSVLDIFSDAPRESIDIRLASDGKNLWYAFESMLPNLPEELKCNHFLNIAKYDISKNNPALTNSQTHIVSTGCPTTRGSYENPPSDLPENSEAVDDPTPFYYNGKYIILTRAWNSSVQHIRTFDNDFNKIEDFTLDLKSVISDKKLSQNALVNVKDQIYLIGGLGNGAPANQKTSSGIYAIPLSDDLHSVSGEIIPLVTSPDRYYLKTTKAIYDNGKLYINYFKAVGSSQLGYLGIFDVENNFASLTQIQIQEKPLTNLNHTSFEVSENKVYVFYQGEQNKLPVILGKVFEWKL